MSRYIDADALKKSIDDCDICNICPDKDVRCDYDCDFPDCLTPKWETLIDSAPSIDIVFCKECKYERQCRKAVEHITHEPTSVTIGYKSVEWCSYGERKEK